ncbi:MAG: alpha/beta hydrolase-fold protein [Thermodesulfobacteriota bacterium]
MRSDTHITRLSGGYRVLDPKATTVRWAIPLTIGILLFSTSAQSNQLKYCTDHPELVYLLSPEGPVRFRYDVRYETFFSRALGKEKNFFLILPEIEGNAGYQFPLLVLLHGYNFHRNGWKFRVCDPERNNEITCIRGEEQYHWLVLEDIALIHQAMTDPLNTTYGELEANLRQRFEELKAHGGLIQDDYSPVEIARSIVRENLNPKGSPRDPFTPIYPMALLLPDGDNSFYANENEGRLLFPPTASRERYDDYLPRECLKYSLIPLRYMKPGALGQYETYLVELIRFLQNNSPDKDQLVRGVPVGIGGISMGGFGAMNLGLKYRSLVGSISSQSGLLDIELLTDKLMLKTIMPEFIEVFGRLKPRSPFFQSSLDTAYLRESNPIRRIQSLGMTSLPPWMYFDYGANEGFGKITRGNQNLELLLHTGSQGIPPQASNGNGGHNFQFWRSRAPNVLLHHSRFFEGHLGNYRGHQGKNPLQ